MRFSGAKAQGFRFRFDKMHKKEAPSHEQAFLARRFAIFYMMS